MDQLEGRPMPPKDSDQRASGWLGDAIRRFIGKDRQEALDKTKSISEFLREELKRFKAESANRTQKGLINKWELWPVSGKPASPEQLKVIMQNLMDQLPKSDADPKSSKPKSVGMYAVKEIVRRLRGEGNLNEVYESALRENVVISYTILDKDYLGSVEEALSNSRYPSMKSLNSPDVIVLRQQTIPPSPEVQSDLQLMLRSASGRSAIKSNL